MAVEHVAWAVDLAIVLLDHHDCYHSLEKVVEETKAEVLPVDVVVPDEEEAAVVVEETVVSAAAPVAVAHLDSWLATP